jgi:cytochrome c biogenesis protein CcmG/thiol:disulfide interchange protein DsbE
MWQAVVLLVLPAAPSAYGQARVRAELQPREHRTVAAEFRLQDSFGKFADLKKYRGKIVLLDFWATWCHGCKEEIPWFAEFESKYREQGLRVIGVSLDDDGWKTVKPFIETSKVPYRIVLGKETTSKAYSIEQMPDTFLIDRDGRIAAKYVGLVDKDNVETNIRAVLAER